MDNILLEKQDHIAVITIDHPPANAWDRVTMENFETAVNDVEEDRQIRVVILTGAGEKCFSAGYDVKDAANAHIVSPKGREIWTRLDRFSKPGIAAINGFALGGGLELALACQFRIMADGPKIFLGLTELNLGIIPGWGGTQRLTRIVGKDKAMDMILFSKTVNAKEALEMGLVNRICPPEKLMAETLDFANRLAQRPPIAVSCVLKAMAAGTYEGIDEGLKVEEQGSKIVRETEDRKEGFTAFLEKRTPVFRGN
jgi:enoyl-CoA hydratase/carnithine racemase